MLLWIVSPCVVLYSLNKFLGKFLHLYPWRVGKKPYSISRKVITQCLILDEQIFYLPFGSVNKPTTFCFCPLKAAWLFRTTPDGYRQGRPRIQKRRGGMYVSLILLSPHPIPFWNVQFGIGLNYYRKLITDVLHTLTLRYNQYESFALSFGE